MIPQLLLGLTLLVAGAAQAQPNSEPPGVKPARKAASAARSAPGGPAGAAGGLSGSGPGVHSPDSPFAPLPVRTDVVPLTCSFCTPGGPESMVEVKTRVPVKATMEPVVAEGRFLVLNDDAYGLYYRMTDAVGVR